MRWISIFILFFTFFSFNSYAEEEEIPKVHKYVDINGKGFNEFKVNLAKNHTAIFELKAYVTTDAMEVMLKKHLPMVREIVSNEFSMQSTKSVHNKKKRRKIINKIMKEARKRLASRDFPPPDIDPAEYVHVDLSSFEELLVTKLVYM